MNDKLIDWDGMMVHPSAPKRVTEEQKCTHMIDPKGKMYARIRFYDNDVKRCHDCGTKQGWIHDDGCDWETCPKCNGQLLSCGCDFPKKGGLKK